MSTEPLLQGWSGVMIALRHCEAAPAKGEGYASDYSRHLSGIGIMHAKALQMPLRRCLFSNKVESTDVLKLASAAFRCVETIQHALALVDDSGISPMLALGWHQAGASQENLLELISNYQEPMTLCGLHHNTHIEPELAWFRKYPAYALSGKIVEKQPPAIIWSGHGPHMFETLLAFVEPSNRMYQQIELHAFRPGQGAWIKFECGKPIEGDLFI